MHDFDPIVDLYDKSEYNGEMCEKLVIIHRSVIEEWATRDRPPVSLSQIQRVLYRIDDAVKSAKSGDVIFIEESPNTGFGSLPELVGFGNSARLLGTRAAYCLKIARSVLEANNIPVTLDTEGSLP